MAPLVRLQGLVGLIGSVVVLERLVRLVGFLPIQLISDTDTVVGRRVHDSCRPQLSVVLAGGRVEAFSGRKDLSIGQHRTALDRSANLLTLTCVADLCEVCEE